MIAKRRGCLLFGLLSISLIAWIVMAFVNIKTWLVAICAIAIMAIFDYECFKECKKVFFCFNYFVGIIVSTMIGMALYMSVVSLIICDILMLPLYVVSIELLTTGDKNDDYNDDE